MTVYLLLVNDSKIDTKYFASLYVGVYKADKFGLKSGQPSAHFYALYKNQEPYIIPGLLSHWFQVSLYFFRHAVRVKETFINFINAFFLGGNKI